MYQYFKTLQAVAETDKREYSNIYELTVALAKESGYTRGAKLKKDGTPSKFTISTYSKWDEQLVARWLIYYKNHFIGTLSKHPKLSHCYYDIIQRTFDYFFKALDLDELQYSGQVTMLFKAQLSARISEALYEYGTAGRLERLNAGEEKSLMKRSNAVNYASMSLDQMTEENNIQFGEDAPADMLNPLVMALYSKFDNKKKLTEIEYNNANYEGTYSEYVKHYNAIAYRNNLGKRLLNVMLNTKPTYDVEKEQEHRNDFKTLDDEAYKAKYKKTKAEYVEPSHSATSEGKISTNRILDYMTFSKEEIATEEMRNFTSRALTSAYSLITKTLQKYLEDEGISVDKYDWNMKSKFSFGNEKNITTHLYGSQPQASAEMCM